MHDRNSLSPVGICQVQLLHTPLHASLLLDGSVLESTGEGEGPMQLKTHKLRKKRRRKESTCTHQAVHKTTEATVRLPEQRQNSALSSKP